MKRENVIAAVVLTLVFAFIGWAIYPRIDREGAIEVLRQNGFASITITGYRWFGCSSGDVYSTGFTAVNNNGELITGVVCRGFLKGSTIRFLGD